jgi:DNA-binding transcriptional LysR family regulator
VRSLDPVAEVLSRIDGIISTAGSFDPKTAQRCFTIGAPDALAAIFLGPLVARLAREAPCQCVALLRPKALLASNQIPWSGHPGREASAQCGE